MGIPCKHGQTRSQSAHSSRRRNNIFVRSFDYSVLKSNYFHSFTPTALKPHPANTGVQRSGVGVSPVQSFLYYRSLASITTDYNYQ